MIKTLMVDDDYLVRMFLKNITDWEEEGFHIVADVGNGEEALEIVEEFNPELIITDISMPVMNGIELIKEIRKRERQCKIIVLSCHDDFDHVREALKSGADDYILKNSFNKKNIGCILKDLKEKVKENREEIKKKKNLQKFANIGKYEVKNEFLLNVINNKHDYVNIKEKSHLYNIELSFLKSAVISIHLSNKYSSIKECVNKIEIYEKIKEIINNSIEENIKYEFITVNAQEYVVLIEGKNLNKPLCVGKIGHNILESIKNNLKVVPTIAISDICIGKESASNAYRHTKEALKACFYSKENIFYYKSSNRLTINKNISFDRFYSEIKRRAILGDIDGIMEKCIKQISLFEREILPSEHVIKWLKEVDKLLEVKREEEDYAQIKSINEVYEIINTYENHVKRYPYIKAPIKNVIVAQALDYVVKNYVKPISLTTVADELKVNNTYLSRVFKQETEINFTDYLTLCRIDYAKLLLRSTNEKIKYISSKCGFYEYRYFCKIFKKLVGKSPLSYRNELIDV
ncbi:response regulator transcription factor [Anaeromicrobium sediminis]|uniref:Stage 0 sporulation protein A homolog n=1 Tax=Anaeromicrobium sediminis TaxID=1478221 RepID=A0A267MAN1_9FIRM|nr:response regulator [Anaeromicrobium sediminis]PAB56641.1 hypothetical protein CCE28_20630 [Anaeromicrobium sediminis]